MTERETDDRARGENRPRCPVCGTPNRAGDRFCAECGTPLPPSPDQDQDQGSQGSNPSGATIVFPGGDETTPGRSSAPTETAIARTLDRENSVWVLGARPGAVMTGGLLLLLLALALLVVGQRDATGTIVMLSICTAPLGLLTLAIGIARYVARTTRRG